jgi:hypothetical protein
MKSNIPKHRSPFIPLFRSLILATVLITVIFSCQKELSDENSNNTSNTKTDDIKLDLAQTVTNIQGFVFDEANNAVSGAVVKIGTATTTTNKNGLFFFTNVTTSQHNSVINISKIGYFTQVKATMVSPATDNFIKAQLIRKTIVKTFNAADGATVSLTSGAKLTIPQSAMQTTTGGAYTGKVNVYMHWMDPSDAKILYQMPGELRGITTSGSERMMITYGMLNVELESETNTRLQLDPAKPAGLSFPVPADLLTGAPTSVPMWHFDEEKGRWMEDGVATLSGNTYTTKVNHFSCWNVDVKYDEPLIKYCVKVIDENEKPYSNSHILIRRANDRWGAHGYTNGDGYVCGMIPSNTPLKLEVIGEVGCEQAIFSTPIGPHYKDVAETTVVVRRNPEKTITVKGKAVDCNNQPVSKGYIQATIRSQGFIGKVVNGAFEFTLTRCPSDLEITTFGFDEVNNLLSDEKLHKITGNTIDVGTISICGKPENTINNGLIAHYPLDGNATDLTANKLNGTITGAPAPVANRLGATGKAFSFNGKDQYITIPNTADKNLLPITISLWCKIDPDAGNGANIFNKYLPGSWNGFLLSSGRDATTNEPLIVPWYINNTQNRIIGDYGEPPFNAKVAFNQWIHVVFTVDYKEARIYIDNKLIATKPWTGTAKPSTNGYLWQIGGAYDSWFKGSIDDVRIYNRVLIDSEVKYLFEN